MTTQSHKTLTCTCNKPKCGHTWTTRTEAIPKSCPKCKARDWNKETIYKTVSQGQADTV